MTRKNILIFVMVILFLSGCAGEDTKLNEGTVHINGSITIKSFETNEVGNTTGKVLAYQNRNGIEVKLGIETGPNEFVKVDTAYSENGNFRLVTHQYGIHRITSRINDLIQTEYDSLLDINEMTKEELNINPVEYGPYTRDHYDSLQCELPYPNPAGQTINIEYKLLSPGYVTIKVFTTTGKVIKDLIDGEIKQEGEFLITWNFLNNDNEPVPPNIYFYTIEWVSVSNEVNRELYGGTLVKD